MAFLMIKAGGESDETTAAAGYVAGPLILVIAVRLPAGWVAHSRRASVGLNWYPELLALAQCPEYHREASVTTKRMSAI